MDLGDANSFAVLAYAGVTNGGASTIWGDIGSFPTVSIDGGITVLGTNFAGGTETQDAKLALDVAVLSANGQGPSDGTISADLGGQTLTPGIYDQADTMLLNGGTLTLDAGGNLDAVWIFRGDKDLSVNVGSTISLANSAQACHVYWVMGSMAAIGGGSTFVGTIMAGTSITFGTGATLDGRALAQTGNVTLLSNTITQSTCSVAPTPTLTPTPTPTLTPTPVVPIAAPVVPTGGVATGDGSTSQAVGNTGAYILAAAVLAAVGMGAMGVLITRRRREDDI